jgi:nicotinate-nucleotide pyrophosphorylase (carboxylating)
MADQPAGETGTRAAGAPPGMSRAAASGAAGARAAYPRLAGETGPVAAAPALPAPLAARLTAAGLVPAAVSGLVAAALAEDLAGGQDITTRATIPAGTAGRARVAARSAGVVAGVCVAEAVFAVAGPGDRVRAAPLVADGAAVAPGAELMIIDGPLEVILTAERTALNLLCHLSGIATLTRRWVDAVAGTGARIRDTRKTLPGLRQLQKYAVRCGGGVNHRMSLADAALIKDNHVAAAGSVSEALAAAAAAAGPVPVQVECDTLDQVAEALAAGAGQILLDNFTVSQLAEAVAMTAGRALLEASGGLTLASARRVASTGVDFLAVGALTHSAPALDIGLDLLATQ